ncbi:MAG: sulfotransferase [Burkholderiales bacterium]|nr:sulfotransferase [Burkholderiales bacterium]
MNALLHPLQIELEAGLNGPELPLVLIIGAPRSGTTLVSQLLAATGKFGYISNFVARFWLAPAIGTTIEQALAAGEPQAPIGYDSDHGVTRGLRSPHEFGYFWSGWFDRGQSTHLLPPEKLAEIDSLALKRRIASIERVHARPMCFKNNTWCTFQAAWLAEIMPTSVFVVSRRDPLYLAQSLLLARQERLGNPDLWWSVRPPGYERIRSLPWWDQVTAQAVEIERTMSQAVQRIAPARIIEAPYRDVCDNPRGLVRAIMQRCALGRSADAAAAVVPASFESADTQKVDDERWQLLLDSARRVTS